MILSLVALCSIVLSLSHSSQDQTALVKVQITASEQTYLGDVRVCMVTPPDWILLNCDDSGCSADHCIWGKTVFETFTNGGVNIWLIGQPHHPAIAPIEAYWMLFYAPSEGCVSFRPYEPYNDGHSLLSEVTNVSGADITGELISTCEQNCLGNLNGDDKVSLDDLMIAIEDFGRVLRFNDLTRVLSHFGESCN